jgi:hypothetical protein
MRKDLFFVALLCLPSLQGCGMTYRAEPIEAWVIDAATAKPLEGVVVTANWELEIGTIGGNVPAGQIMIMEAVTDDKGRFYFPAWGPITAPTEFPHPLKSQPHLVNRDPQLLLFKPGYKWRGLENAPLVNYNRGSLRKSEWSGKTIKLQNFTGDLKSYAQSLDFANPQFVLENCNWKKVPQLILALDKQQAAFRKIGIESSIYSIDSLERRFSGVPERCGSPAEFFQERRK